MLREHAWEQRDQNRGWDLAGWDHDSDDDGMSEQEKAAFEFMELLLQQYFAGVITATTFCILCHWVSTAGLVCEAAAEYSLPPCRSSGKYKAHLDEKLEFKQQRHHMYHVDVPGRHRHSEERRPVTVVARFSLRTAS